jgi:hypothetical protein
MRRITITAAIIVAVLGVAGFAYAEAQPPDPVISGDTPGPPVSAPAAQAAAKGRGLLKSVVHGDLLVREPHGTTRTVTLDRGKVGSLSEASITIARADGVSVSLALTDGTTFTGTPRAELQAGMPVIVVSAGGTAERVLAKGALAHACAPGGKAAARRPKLCQRLGSALGTN